MSNSPEPLWVALAGYMGAGKSTVGPRLAAELGRPFVDSDAVIEEDAGMAIPEIFSRKGELWFRRVEERVIRDSLAGPPGVLALGGGALGRERTRATLGRLAQVIWLKLDPEVAWERVAASDRPLAGDRERFLRRGAAREPSYRACADATVDAALTPEEVVAQIVAALGEGAA